jgi:hypothetical protein
VPAPDRAFGAPRRAAYGPGGTTTYPSICRDSGGHERTCARDRELTYQHFEGGCASSGRLTGYAVNYFDLKK